MELNIKNTRWFFLLPSSNEPEERHIYDVALGIKVLLNMSVAKELISVCIDNPPFQKIGNVFDSLSLELPERIFQTKDIDGILQNNRSKKAVVFINGHGSPYGLDATPPIKPFELYKKFQTAPNLNRVIFFFGQCYAGIFDKMPLSTHLGLENCGKCKMMAVGATGLYSSFSTPCNNGNAVWSGNIFLASIFEWLMKKQDIDGDGVFTVMDAFKFAAIRTNEELKNLKKEYALQSISDRITLQSLIERLQSHETPDFEKANLELMIQALEKKFEYRYIIQDPWILNAAEAVKTIL